MSVARRLFLLVALCWPAVAFAHGISWPIVAVFVFSPIAAFLMSIVYGFVTKKWQYGFASFGLIAVWVIWFLIAVNNTTSDILIWIPIVALEIQLLALVVLTLWVTIAKARSKS